MHKLTKGLKKKKKGKKSKHKEDDLFKPEELEAYRKQQQQAGAVTPTGENQSGGEGKDEDWRKFTAEIDNVLKKTQDDLDRIKSTSFFQRVTPKSAPKEEKKESPVKEVAPIVEEPKQSKEPGIVEVSESETEEEEEDDIFDTSYIDAIATGEVKLAYIPESPTEQQIGDDPFDTSIAERAILGPAVERKGKKLVPIGAAVEVLTGRIQAPTCVPVKRPSPKRTAFQQKDLLLGSFDEGTNQGAGDVVKDLPETKPTLLDDDAPPEISTSPIDLSKNLAPIIATAAKEDNKEAKVDDIAKEFEITGSDTIGKSDIEDDADIEFELLAAESLSKAKVITSLELKTEVKEEQWNAFPETSNDIAFPTEEFVEDDPFDTTFAERILPGKAELKLIEEEILHSELDIKQEFKIDRVSETLLQVIQPKHRDLLGGSNTDLTKLGEQPLKPQGKIEDNYIEYCDPFDTSVVDSITEPCQTELKYLEQELLNDFKQNLKEDDDFNPRADESRERKQSVKFVLPLLEAPVEENKKTSKPLTPYYVRENSVPEETDPFDTSAVANGLEKAESPLKENDSLFVNDSSPNLESENVINGHRNSFDLLATEEEVSAKVLTPAKEKVSSSLGTTFDTTSDPFDTSLASNLAPGQTELKLLEEELIKSDKTQQPFFDQNKQITDLLEQPPQFSTVKPLSPIQVDEINEAEFLDEVDPFDTSIADTINLGKTEVKLLESELL